MKCTVEEVLDWLEQHKAVIRCGYPQEFRVTIEAEGLTVKGYSLLGAGQTISQKWLRAQKESQRGANRG